MDLIFVTEARFYKTHEGNYYADDMSYNNLLWNRYLKEFDKVYVIARVFNSTSAFDESFYVDNVHFLPLPAFEDIISYGKNFFSIKKYLNSYIKKDSTIIIRGGGALGYTASRICKKQNLPYGVEVIGDPYEVFAPGVIRHPLRIVLRYLFTYIQEKVVKEAVAVIYVTKYALQKRYPASEKAFTTYASDVFLDSSNLVLEPKKLQSFKEINLISIGSLDQMYKSPDILIKAIKMLVSKGIDVKLTWLGKGKYQQDMERLVQILEIEDKVKFAGSVSSTEVTKYLDNSDVFLLVSRTEGLPRAMVEAMSRGLPCIGTKVGGIPELLQKEFLVDPESPEQICDKVQFLLKNREVANIQSKINLENSKEYSFEGLDSKRANFYRFLKNYHN
ncbi:glycosyltransferase [Flavobacterium ranwuense]|uniref:Glycosyltransferase n=1 Tax=Flavobacterium ranwuense TaxID=2541725 RepID=A0ABY2DQV9_9FLAO|nr:glycosyltransferase family 4 protein [Flavobacterium ranwuense]TDE29158.1 glycosyltransferase [Flavobacterium ranwuense]